MDDEYERLKSLLLSEEKQRLSSLQEELDALTKETRDPKKIAEAVSPIIGQAISAQIKKKRNEIIDALYPIMGNMISKFVTESFKDMIREINTKVESTFSFQMLKRKIKAKIKGISEAELLLQDSNKSYAIVTVFLIHKETGILISERTASGEGSIEPDMLVSMLSAIRSFVNDWISKSGEDIELNEIEFGDSTIQIEAAGCCYMATVFKGTINRAGQLKIIKVLENLVEAHSHLIAQFDGDVKTLPIEKINIELDTLFTQDDYASNENEKSNSKKSFILWILLVLLLSATSWFIYKSYIRNQAELKIRSVLYEDPYLNLYNLNVTIEDSVVTLDGRLPEKSLHERLLLKVRNALPHYGVDDNSVLTNSLPTDEQILSQLESITNTINMHMGNHVSYELNKGVVQIKGLVVNDEIRKGLNKNIAQLNGVKQLISTLKNNPSGDSITIYFKAGKVLLEGDNKTLLRNWFEENTVMTLLDIYADLDLLVIGYTDNNGNIRNNVKISNQRSDNVLKYLLEQGVPVSRVKAIGVPFHEKDATKTVTNSRYVEIKWIKK